jgi:hypothetical protein
MISLIFILILILICIIACSNKLIYFGGNLDKKTQKHNYTPKFLFPTFGINSKNKILHINQKHFLTKHNFKEKLNKNDIRSIILQTYHYPDKIGIINHILHKLIYPIQFNNMQLYTEEWRKEKIYLFTDYNLTPKINLKWQIPKGLYLHKILEEYECDILTDLFLKSENNFTVHIRDNIYEDYVTVNNNISSNKSNPDINYFISQLKNKKLIHEFKKCIDKFFNIFYKKYDKKFIYQILYNITIGFYSTDKNTGKNLHIDNYDHDDIGPVSIISLNNSILDFIPSQKKISYNDSFRVIIPKGYCITFDGDIRHYYAHGVPKNIPFPNKYRVGINIRHLLSYKQHNNNFNCTLEKKIKSKYPCTSASFDNPLSFI